MGENDNNNDNKPNYFSQFVHNIKSFNGNLVLGFKYVISDIKRNKKNTLIGIFTIFLVLTFVCLLFHGIQRTPIIFLKVAENEVGEFDLLLTPKTITSSTEYFTSDELIEDEINEGTFFLNQTEIDSILGLSQIYSR